ncbi:AAA family ATPase [Alkalilimnicola ehrlichii MLHE-1]|uniref:ATPase associated with various cellular activities, AAA_3 n=1 Tax=Alkalilimnicola ehrlichii (strain ATCC BAA-1101 / DSM 17681 / MLHE-1) TaxID=187272 RepID=Q0A7G0_ALKEH|nr:AAA family ATPase [Alkalilimnicola ehrlichii]ABI57227.1 ATPase associated with various cellular activities, AAA_3 [Alkalilimnicola ehrlichii MLHE-1]
MQQDIRHFLAATNEIILGKAHQVRLALVCLIARGHLLIEDLPGVGKTTLAQALARLLGLDFQRIQFTSDLLPADIIGATVYEKDSGRFRFHPGPVFTSLVLADEVNRATPKAQSALLEAMAERQVSVEGETRALPDPFFVIATQNPDSQLGTFPLPESQLDRFLMRLSLGYPGHDAERALLRGTERRDLLHRIDTPALSPEQLRELQTAAPRVHASDALLDYLQALLRHTRECGRFRHGLSPRAGLALLRTAQAWALVDDRGAVLPEDIQAVFVPVAGHRLEPREEGGGQAHEDLVRDSLEQVTIP